MIEDGFLINMWEEVATATKVKWWVKDGVVFVVVIILEQLVQCHQVHRDLNF
jgi:hypothetical protein